MINEKLGEKITKVIGKITEAIGEIRKDFGSYAYLILAPLLLFVLHDITTREWSDHYYARYDGYESFENIWPGIICFFIFCSITYFYFSIWLKNRVKGCQFFLKNMVPLILIVEMAAFIFLYKFYIVEAMQDAESFNKIAYEEGLYEEIPPFIIQKYIALSLLVLPWITAAIIYLVPQMKIYYKNKNVLNFNLILFPTCLSLICSLLFLVLIVSPLFLLIVFLISILLSVPVFFLCLLIVAQKLTERQNKN